MKESFQKYEFIIFYTFYAFKYITHFAELKEAFVRGVTILNPVYRDPEFLYI